MSLEVVSNHTISDLAQKLKAIIGGKKNMMSAVAANIEFGMTLVGQLENLQKTIKKAIMRMDFEKKEIKEMENKFSKIDRLKEINLKSDTYEEEIILFAECDSIIDNQSNILNKDCIENINQNIEILIDQIGNQIMTRNVLPKSKKANATQYVSGKAGLEPNIKPSGKIQEPIRIKNNIVLSSKGETFDISKLNIFLNDPKRFGNELVKYEKECEECKLHKRLAFILGCNCILCIDCIKTIVMKNKTTVYNTFDAQHRKQETVCVCPNHDCSIEPKILQAIFGGKKLEEDSVAAMRKQLKYGTALNKYRPNVCMGCKGLIKDEGNAAESIALCRKHKVCVKCRKKHAYIQQVGVCVYCESRKVICLHV
eukprot:TRINITY_DN4354_c0_g1_i8.p1 TRINITY_DN4354_c0_g1~~TRINITY_DN4354_c0_g1_i8.p1  ORF type:complete len:368 (-),score=83.01 TRINITY_DN4354_c0_g1_i8:134-1237(-)